MCISLVGSAFLKNPMHMGDLEEILLLKSPCDMESMYPPQYSGLMENSGTYSPGSKYFGHD